MEAALRGDFACSVCGQYLDCRQMIWSNGYGYAAFVSEPPSDKTIPFCDPCWEGF